MTHDATSSEPAAQGTGADRPGTPPLDDVPCNTAESGSGSGSGSGPDPKAAEQEAESTLPPLTPQEFRIYNRLAEQMDYFVLSLLLTAHHVYLLTSLSSTTTSAKCTQPCRPPAQTTGAQPT